MSVGDPRAVGVLLMAGGFVLTAVGLGLVLAGLNYTFKLP